MSYRELKKLRRQRSKLPTETLRSRTIGVRVNTAEFAVIEAKALQVGLPVAQWLRNIALSRVMLRPLVPPVNRQAYSELARLAANLNQISRAAHMGQAVVAAELLENTQRQVRLLRKELLGMHHDCEDSER